ncbi:P2X purinoceptor 1 isoform X1 [Latimeria chalumnae]|uniref:P2X purinoceptor 1 isoform X1 n=1 Tax=Latimeria chalumnae TaxID=7897 RepID=UPI0003C1A456|nr:PREDICTED: P2X purinoceptor 1 isoform X1 [Latimeria chalumnae]|eukprot:XP_005988644.1 PREDICTED: P2X purinoceptor 1 isoform X1 [Latimeria chalumnae]
MIMGNKNGFVDRVLTFVFEYDTPRMVLVRDKKVGVTFRLIQLGVLAYIIGWVFIYEKGYQSVDGIISSVSVKVKGIAYSNNTHSGPRVWDVADYVFPPQGEGGFVVMTNVITTPRQKQDFCPELPEAGKCQSNRDCEKGKADRQGQGIMTGKCLHYSANETTCEIFGWCPVENDHNIPDPPLLKEAENFTVFIKNSISFTQFRVARRNLVESINSTYLKKCIYNKVTDPYCPIFQIGYMVNESGQDFKNLSKKGGIVGIIIDWDCNLDWSVKFCRPTYQFHRLYDASKKERVSGGFNFRYAKYYQDTNGTERRTLFKVFGIRFDILVHGKAGKFDIIPTMTTIGSGVGIFGVATVLCDLMLLHLLPRRNYYKQKKFKHAEDKAENQLQSLTRLND